MKRFNTQEREDFLRKQNEIEKKAHDLSMPKDFSIPVRMLGWPRDMAMLNMPMFRSMMGYAYQFNPYKLMQLYIAVLEYKGLFSMGTYRQTPEGAVARNPSELKDECGTAHCLAGIGAYAGIGLQADEVYNSWAIYSHIFCGGSNASFNLWEYFFGSNWNDISSDKIANAKRIPFFLSTGLITVSSHAIREKCGTQFSWTLIMAGFMAQLRYMNVSDDLLYELCGNQNHTYMNISAFGILLLPEIFDKDMAFDEYFSLLTSFANANCDGETENEFKYRYADSVTEPRSPELEPAAPPSSEA